MGMNEGQVIVSKGEMSIRDRIFTVRGVQVMLDRDLAAVYNVSTSAFNQAVKRNAARFPPEFMFQLTRDELRGLMSQIVISKREAFHDRFLVIDDRDLYLVGASLKDLGKKCFGFTKMDAGEIAGLKARI